MHLDNIHHDGICTNSLIGYLILFYLILEYYLANIVREKLQIKTSSAKR